MTGKRSDCERLKPSLVALVYGEEHPDIPALLEHLGECGECSRERSDFQVIRARTETLLGSAVDAAFLEGFEAAEAPRGSPGRKGWLLSHALPACAAALLVAFLFLSSQAGPPGERQAIEDRIFEKPAVAAARSYDAGEIDRRLDWISYEIERLEPDSW
jgi:hypothetical protein